MRVRALKRFRCMVNALVRFECVAIFTVHLHCQRSGPGTSTVLQLVRVLVRRYWSPVRVFVQCAGALLAIVTAKRNNVFLSGVTMFQSPFTSAIVMLRVFWTAGLIIEYAGVSRCGRRSRSAARASARAESVAPRADDRRQRRHLTTTESRVRTLHHSLFTEEALSQQL